MVIRTVAGIDENNAAVGYGCTVMKGRYGDEKQVMRNRNNLVIRWKGQHFHRRFAAPAPRSSITPPDYSLLNQLPPRLPYATPP